MSTKVAGKGSEAVAYVHDNRSGADYLQTIADGNWSERAWLRRYVVASSVWLVILALILIIGPPSSFDLRYQLSYFVLAPAFALLGIYVGMEPRFDSDEPGDHQEMVARAR